MEDDDYQDEDEVLGEIKEEGEKSNIVEITYKDETISRPPPNMELINEQHDIFLMPLEVDYHTDNLNQTIIRLFAVNNQGNSFLVLVHGFLSYFFVEPPLGFDLSPNSLNQLKKVLNVIFFGKD